MKRIKYLRRWVRHLRAAGLPDAHSAHVLAVDVAQVEAVPLHTPWDKPLRFACRDKRPLDGSPAAPKVRRLSELGYSDATISDILRLEESSVRSYLAGRAQQLRHQEERTARLEADRLRKDRNAARRAARREGARVRREKKEARWPHVADVSYDSLSKPPAAQVVADATVEATGLPPAASPLFFEPNRWDGPLADHGKLSPLDVKKIRWLAKYGKTPNQLASQFGVSATHIRGVVKRKYYPE